MKIERIILLIKKENLFFIRSKKIFFLIVAMLALGVLQIGLSYAFKSGKDSFSNFIYGAYNTYGQFFTIAVTGVLAGVICSEKENKTWDFYFTKTFTKFEIITSKIIFYNLVILLTMIFVWIIIFFAGNLLNLEDPIKFINIIYIIVISLSSIFTIINLEIFISGVSKKTSISALSIVILWIVLLIINVLVPKELGGGYLAPFAQNSFQTSVVHRLLGMQGYVIPFESITNYPTSLEVFKAIFYAVSEGVVFIACSLIFTKKENLG